MSSKPQGEAKLLHNLQYSARQAMEAQLRPNSLGKACLEPCDSHLHSSCSSLSMLNGFPQNRSLLEVASAQVFHTVKGTQFLTISLWPLLTSVTL